MQSMNYSLRNSLLQQQKGENITFESNMQHLHFIKEQLLRLQFQFSNKSTNVNQQSKIERLNQKMAQNQSQTSKKIDELQSQLQTMQAQKQQLYQMNEELVKSNESFAVKLQASQIDKEDLYNQLVKVQKQKEWQIKKFKKEFQNLKLMHAQEIYILKKKNQKKQAK